MCYPSSRLFTAVKLSLLDAYSELNWECPWMYVMGVNEDYGPRTNKHFPALKAYERELAVEVNTQCYRV